MKSGSEYSLSPYWHVNFVNKARLPDIHLYKTQKLVAYVMCLLAAFLGGALIYKVIDTHILESKVHTLQERIQNRSKANAENLRLSDEFEKRAWYIKAIEIFNQNELNLVTTLVALGGACPDNLFIDGLDLSNNSKAQSGDTSNTGITCQISIKGGILGTYDQALSTVNNLNEALSQNAYIKQRLMSYEVKELNKDTDSSFRYFIVITLKGAR